MNIKICVFNLSKKLSLKFIIIIYFIIIYYITLNLRKLKIGVIGLEHSQNIGNNLLKYAIFIKLKEFGFNPFIIGKRIKNDNITFIKNSVNLIIINQSFSEVRKDDYDILIVNSDQTWRKSSDLYDIAFLKFAEKWEKPKFIYGASWGVDTWTFSKKDERIAKHLLKNFTGISLREKGSIKFIEKHLGIKPSLVLDPTFLIDKKYYINLIKNFKNDIFLNKNFIFIYTLTDSKQIRDYIKKIKENSNYKFYKITINTQEQIKKFIYGIINCKATITDSYHGTIFSIIFNKPFISFVYKSRGKERFNTLGEVFALKNRIFNFNSNPDENLLNTPLNLNKSLINSLKIQSINFLKKNLYFKK